MARDRTRRTPISYPTRTNPARSSFVTTFVGNALLRNPQFQEFTAWAAGAILERDIDEWVSALQDYDSTYTSPDGARGAVLHEYGAVVAGFREGTEYLTAKHLEVPSTGETATEENLQEMSIEGFGDYAKDQFLDLAKTEIKGAIEAVLGEVIASTDEALIGASETIVPLLIAAVVTTTVGIVDVIDQAHVPCVLRGALSNATNDSLYSDINGTTKNNDCDGNEVSSISQAEGLALLLDALVSSTMPDFSNLRSQAATPGVAYGPAQVSEPCSWSAPAVSMTAARESPDLEHVQPCKLGWHRVSRWDNPTGGSC